MPRISKQKRDTITEHILHHLFEKSPEPQFTASIAMNIARDEEFTKSLLTDLEKVKMVVKVMKNPSGIDYSRRQRWRMSNEAFDIYKKHQSR